MKIILASQSPGRKELLAHVVSEFEIEPADIDETSSPDKLPIDHVHKMAEEEARIVQEQKEKKDSSVIVSDTAVVPNQEIMGRPEDMVEAEVMLKKLSGETYIVYTAVALKTKEREEQILAEAHVTFYPPTDEEVNRYLEMGDYADKVGIYGIQGAVGVFVKEISGDYCSIIGFPIGAVNQALKTSNQIKKANYLVFD